MQDEMVIPNAKGLSVLTRPDDAKDVEQLLSGDMAAFRRIFRRYSPEVVALCKRILGSEQDAEDVAADVFFEVWSRRERFEPKRGTLRSYLLMLARSRSIDLYRSRARERKLVATPTEFVQQDLVSDAVTPDGDVSLSEFQASAREALTDLGDVEKSAIELAFFEGLSHSQIASRLDSPLGTVKSHIRRGPGKLKQKLQEWNS